MENKKWFFANEEVDIVRWVWSVTYNDGTELKQYDDNGVFHQFKEIDQDKVNIFKMTNTETGKHFSIIKTAGMQIFHFYRNIGTMVDGANTRRIFVFGYKENGSTHYNYIIDDEIIMSSQEVNIKF